MLTLLTPPATTPASPFTSCQPGAEQASALLDAAGRAMQRRDFATANTVLDDALRGLGSGYARPDVIDDTGMHLVVAGVQARKGRLKAAAELKRQVLVERLDLCRRPARTIPPH